MGCGGVGRTTPSYLLTQREQILIKNQETTCKGCDFNDIPF